MKCPRLYGSYDVMTANCPKCKQGHLYQVCKDGDHLACAGWLDPKTWEPLCCEHHEKRHPEAQYDTWPDLCAACGDYFPSYGRYLVHQCANKVNP